MKKALLFLSGFLFYSGVYSQCEVSTSATATTIRCGQSVSLSAFGQSNGTVILNETFNSGSFGPGWGSTPGATSFSNPCSPGGVDGTPHAWMDNNTSVPRTLNSAPYNLSSATAGVTVCFDLLFAEQGNSAPCEGPDEPDEGVYLQYSTDGGTTWTDITYFDPNGGNDAQLVNWNNWCFPLPAGAITANTIIRWHQTADSGADYDHWGIDNVEIFQNDVSGQLVWLHDGYAYGVGNPGGVNPNAVTPTTTTTYTAQLTTGSGTVCTNTITITVLPPEFDVNITATPATVCTGDCANITATAVEVISPASTPTFENNEFDLVTGGSASVNINVQGLNTTSITNGTITEVVINGFDFSGNSFCSNFGGCPCNGGTVAFGSTCTLNTSGFEVTLTAPGGCDIILVPAGTATGNYSNTTFVPVGGSAFGGTFPNGGTWNPSEPMSGLNGCNPNGVWTLSFNAGSIGIGVGTLSGWSISFNDPAITGPVTYTWSPTTNMTNSNTLTPTVCPANTTTYDLTVSNSNPGCPTYTEGITVTVSPCSGCTPPTATITNPAAVCAPSTINLASAVSGTGTAILTYHTTNADATADTNPLGSSTVSASGTYFVRVEDSTDPTCFIVQPITVTINPLVNISVTPTSPTICPGASTTLTASGGSNYSWTGPSGFTATTNTITVTPAATSTYVVTSPGCPGVTTVSVTVNVSSAVATGPITGNNSVCPNETGVTYSVPNVIGSTYAWTVPSGASITAGQGTNSITVAFGATGGNIAVTETASCGTASATLAVAVTSTPITPVIVGSATVCPNATAVTYSVSSTGSTYVWTVPAGATIASGQGTNTITINFGATGGNVGLTETTSCGNGTASFSVTTSTTPITPTIVGPAAVCPNATAVTYSVSSTGSTYTWTVPAGATIASGQGTNTITVNFGATGGNISLTETTGCGTGNDLQTVAVSNTPTTPPITGDAAVCAGSTTLYSVTNTIGSTYTWTVPAGAVITSTPIDMNMVTIDWTASTGGVISVVENSTCGTGTTSTFTVTIINAPAVPTLVGNFIVCENATAETYSVTNNIGSTYLWTVTGDATITSGQGTNAATINFGTTAGFITIRETNACGFGEFSQQYLLIPPPTTPVVSGPSPVCAGTNYTYSVPNNVGSTYNWTVPAGAIITGGQGTNSITVSFGATGGNVNVTETASCGTTASAPLAVTITPAPSTPVISGVLNVCENATNVTYAVTSNVGSTYSWTTTGGITIASGANTNLITVNFNTAGGTVNITETNTCGNVPASITVTTTNVTINAAPASICPGFSTNLSASGATTYTWSPAAGLNTTSGANVIANPTVTTVYTISGSDGTCIGDTTVTVTLLPPLTINLTSSTTNLCSGNTSTINASGADTYIWTPAATLSSSTGTSVVANPSITTTYSVAGSTATCAGTNTITITVTPEPIISLTPNSVTICEGDSAIVTASGATTYAWAPNTNFNSIDPPNNTSVNVYPSTTTTYTVIGTTNGCNNSAMVDVTVLPKITPNAGLNDTICFGQTANLLGSGGQSYSWSPTFGLSTPTSAFTTATPFVTTNYILTASYNGLCAETDTVRVVVNSLPTVYAGNDTTIDVEDVVILNGFSSATNYNWLNGSTLNCTNCLSPTASPLETTTYILIATNQFGCTYADTVTIEVSQEYALYVPSALSPNEDNVNEGWKPQGFGIKKIHIWVYDRWGQKIFEAKDLDTTWNGTYKNDIVQQDVYVYKITAETYSGNKFTKVGHVTVVR